MPWLLAHETDRQYASIFQNVLALKLSQVVEEDQSSNKPLRLVVGQF